VERLLRDIAEPAAIGVLSLAEIIDVLVRRAAIDESVVRDRLELLIIGGLEVHPASESTAMLAGSIRARRYHRTDNPISLADCMTLATAIEWSAALVTADGPLAATARAEACSVISLPNSGGRPV
jgi:predicted nucleic acid-binding protein